VLVDGTEIDPVPDLPNTLVIDGSGTDGVSNYSLTVTDELFHDALGGDYDLAVDGASARGTVDGARHEYVFSGDLIQFDLDGNASITLEDND
jgi:hypothetical protein